MKRFIALVLATLMVIALVPGGIFAFDTEPSDTIVHQSGVFFDNAETVPLDGTPLKAFGSEGFVDSYTPNPENQPTNMTLLFEVSGIRNPVTFGRFHVNSQGTGGGWIDSNNSGNYTMDTSFTIPSDGQYALQTGFYFVSWDGDGHFASIDDFTLFGGTRGVEFSSNNPAATVKLVGVVDNALEYDVVFCAEDGSEITSKTGGFTICNKWGARLEQVPSLVELYDGEIPTKEETEQFRYEYEGWQTADGTPVDFANFSGKVYPRFKEIDKTKATVTFKDGDGFVIGEKIVTIGEAVTYDGDIPTKSEDDNNTYEWTGEWDTDLSSIQGDVVVTALFNTVPKPKYTMSAPDSVTNESELSVTVYPINFDGMTNATMTLKYDNRLFKVRGCAPVATIVSDEDGLLTLELSAGAIDGFTVDFDVLYEAFKVSKTTLTSGGSYGVDGEKSVYEYSIDLSVDGLIPGFFAESDESGSMVPQSVPSSGSVTFYKNDAPGFTTTYCYTLIFKVENLDAPLTIGNLQVTATKPDGSDQPYMWSSNWTNPTYNYPSIVTFEESGIYSYTINSVLGGLTGPTTRLHSVTGNTFVSGDWEIGTNADNRPIAVPTEESALLQDQLNQNATVQIIAVLEGNFTPETKYYNVDGQELGTSVHVYNERGDSSNWSKATVENLVTYSEDYLASYETPTYSDPEKPYLRYDFTGWADKDGAPATHVYRSAKVYATYDVVDTRPDCTITFMNDGSVYDRQVIKEGEMPLAPTVNPTKPSTDEYSYIFKGWDADGDGNVDEITAATVEGATYTAVYEQVDRRWEVKYYAEDKETYLGSLYVLGEIEDGTEPTAPVKPADVQYTYTFDKWVFEDGSELVKTEVTEDTAVYATYTATLNKYTVTFLDEDGKELDKVTVDYGTAATTDEPTKASDELYTYKFAGWDADTSNVVGDMTVKATYTKTFSKFTDVAPDAWYAKQVEYVVVNNYFSGMSPTTFEPQTKATRAMVVRVLYSAAGSPSVEGLTTPFNDVPAGEWYSNAVTWAYNSGVVFGMSDTEFAPNASVRREEFCAFLYRYAEKVHLIDGKNVDMTIPTSDITSSLSTFKDRNDIDLWAHAAVKWCKYAKIVQGTKVEEDTYFYPQNGLTRAELATMIKGFFESDKLVPLA